VKHGINALKASAQDTDLTEHNVSIGVVGKGYPYRQFSKAEIRALLTAEAASDVEMIQT
jgi:hypothetical protein